MMHINYEKYMQSLFIFLKAMLKIKIKGRPVINGFNLEVGNNIRTCYVLPSVKMNQHGTTEQPFSLLLHLFSLFVLFLFSSHCRARMVGELMEEEVYCLSKVNNKLAKQNAKNLHRLEGKLAKLHFVTNKQISCTHLSHLRQYLLLIYVVMLSIHVLFLRLRLTW